jgi:hypothetical protein
VGVFGGIDDQVGRGAVIADTRAAAARAAAMACMVDSEAVSWIMPKKQSGRPSHCRSQRMTTISSSVLAGDDCQSMPLVFRAAESISPRMPGAEALTEK